jgi:PST family polysaccharide transporter
MGYLADLSARLGFRKAAANFGWLFAERAVRFAVGALVGLFVARYLGPVRLGELSYCLALVALLSFLPALGLDAILKRDLLLAPDKTHELLASATVLRLALSGVTYLGVTLVAFMGWGFVENEARLFAILALALFQPALALSDLWLQVHLRARLAVAVQLAALVLSSALRVWLITVEGSLTAFAWVFVFETALVVLGLFLAAHRAGLRFPIQAANAATMRRLAKEAWPLMFASLAVVVYMKIDEVMLRHLAGTAEVGTYAAAAKLSEMWYFLPSALASSLLPALVRAREQGSAAYCTRLQEYFDLSVGIAYALSVPVAFLAPWLVRLTYGVEFSAAGPILAVHIWSSTFVFLGVARGQWLVNEGKQNFYLVSTCAGAIANILLNLVFIPISGGLGAAYATVISYSLAAWLASYLHPDIREIAAMQTRALLVPIRGLRYLVRRFHRGAPSPKPPPPPASSSCQEV